METKTQYASLFLEFSILMPKPLSQKFFARNADIVAKELLGCRLFCRQNGKLLASKIVETEAYIGIHDLACHASKGRTPRTEIMFGPAGRAYVYLIYGMYSMLNVVTSRIGVDYAGPWRDAKLRYYATESDYVSRP